MFELLRKSSIIDRVFVSVVVMACLLAVVGAGAAWRLHAQSGEIAQLTRDARALEGGAARKLADAADTLSAQSAASALTVALTSFASAMLGIVAEIVLRLSIKYPVETPVDSAT